MIDLSHLTEEEQEAIMLVLQRDSKLKKAEEERVKQLQTQGPEKGKLKYITGEWFYEVKSQRHQDRIHGSDIIMASMKQKRPTTVDFLTQSWREQPCKTNNELMTPQPKSTDDLRERRTTETHQESLKRQRHNPFNNIPVDLDIDLTSGALLPDARNSPAELVLPLETHEEIETKAKTKVLDILHPHEKPVPKKRTKFFKVERSGPDSTSSVSSHSVSTNPSVSTQSVSTFSSTKSPMSTSSMSTNSDSRSTLSTQSMSTNSEIRPRPLKGILKHCSSCDSTDSNIKSRLPQPHRSHSFTKTGHEHILEKNAISVERIKDCSLNVENNEPLKLISSTIPKSRLPVRSSILLNNRTQTTQEKPEIQPQLSSSSSTQSNDKQKISDIQQKCEHNEQNKADEIKKHILISKTQVRSPFESLLVKPSNQSTTAQISPKNQEKEETATSNVEYKKIKDKLDQPLTISDLLATRPIDVSSRTDPSLVASKSPFDKKTNINIDKKTKNSKDPIIVNSPKSSEEQGDSIAKVLEWFSRSSDSSDKHDSEEIISETGVDLKIEDIDFEDELNLTPKTENVYLIIPKHSIGDEAMINDRFLEERDIAGELNIDKKEPSINSQAVQELINQTKPFSKEEIYDESSSLFRQRSPQGTINRLYVPKKTSEKDKLVETIRKKKERRNANQAEEQNWKPTQHELEYLTDSQSPNIANLKSLSDQYTTDASEILVQKTNKNSELKNLDQFNRNVAESEGQSKSCINPTYSLIDHKKKSHVNDISNADKIQPDKTYELLKKKEAVVRVEANDMQPLKSNTNHFKHLPTSGVEPQQQNTVPLTKQSMEQEKNRTEKIKELKSFWEKEELQSNIYMKSTNSTNTMSSLANTKLNKRLTKSEYDLTSIDTELKKETFNFTVLPSRYRVEKTDTGEAMANSQFKMLLEFWGGSRKSPNFQNTNERPNKENTMPAKKPKGLESSLKEQTVVRHLDISATSSLHNSSPNFLRSSNCLQPKSGLQFSLEDIASPESPQMLSKESQLQIRSSGNSALNGRGNSLRRATSMYSINPEPHDLELPLQSKDAADTVFSLPAKTTESVISPSTKAPAVKASLEFTNSKQKVAVRGTSEEPECHLLARLQDSKDYRGIAENRDKCLSVQDGEPTDASLLTSFQTDGGVRCCPEQADTLIDSVNLFMIRERLGLPPGVHASEDTNSETLNRTDPFSRASAKFKVSLVQEVLRRASIRPVYHKSLEDITAVPQQSKQNDFMQSSYADSSTQSPSSLFDKDHLKKISKSVPSFLDNKKDSDESDSECSSHSDKHWKTNSLQDELNSNLRVDTKSSISGSISSADNGKVDVQGTIQFSINYVQKLREFHIFVVQCQNLSAVDVKKNRSDPYVKSYLIPDTANLGKRKSSVKKKTLNPIFNEILRYKVRKEYLITQILNLSVWHNDTFGRNSFLGQTEIDLSTWDFENTQLNRFSLKPRTISSLLSTDDRGEIRLAMRFLPHISYYKSVKGSGEIHIWVRDCKNLPMIHGVPINTYLKCLVLPDTRINSCQKTRVLKRTSNPVFNHTMVYDGFMTEDLKEACVELTVWNHDRLADYLVGGIRLSLGTGQSHGTEVDWMDSDAKEVDLWQRMMDSPNEWVEDAFPLRVLTPAKNT